MPALPSPALGLAAKAKEGKRQNIRSKARNGKTARILGKLKGKLV